MSDAAPSPAKKSRSAVNVKKFLNTLRLSKGLPNVLTKEKPVAQKITAEIKDQITTLVITDLYPEALTDSKFLLTDAIKVAIEKEYKKKIEAYKAGKLKL